MIRWFMLVILVCLCTYSLWNKRVDVMQSIRHPRLSVHFMCGTNNVIRGFLLVILVCLCIYSCWNKRFDVMLSIGHPRLSVHFMWWNEQCIFFGVILVCLGILI